MKSPGLCLLEHSQCPCPLCKVSSFPAHERCGSHGCRPQNNHSLLILNISTFAGKISGSLFVSQQQLIDVSLTHSNYSTGIYLLMAQHSYI